MTHPSAMLAAPINLDNWVEIAVVAFFIMAAIAKKLADVFTRPSKGALRGERPSAPQRKRETWTVDSDEVPVARTPSDRPMARPMPQIQMHREARNVPPPAARPIPPVADDGSSNPDVGHLPEVILEMLGIPRETLTRRRDEQVARRAEAKPQPKPKRPVKPAQPMPRQQKPARAQVAAERRVRAAAPPERTTLKPRPVDPDHPANPRVVKDVPEDAVALAGLAAAEARSIFRSHSLRQAVIWSEVLAPPVSMRELRDSGWSLL